MRSRYVLVKLGLTSRMQYAGAGTPISLSSICLARRSKCSSGFSEVLYATRWNIGFVVTGANHVAVQMSSHMGTIRIEAKTRGQVL